VIGSELSCYIKKLDIRE